MKPLQRAILRGTVLAAAALLVLGGSAFGQWSGPVPAFPAGITQQTENGGIWPIAIDWPPGYADGWEADKLEEAGLVPGEFDQGINEIWKPGDGTNVTVSGIPFNDGTRSITFYSGPPTDTEFSTPGGTYTYYTWDKVNQVYVATTVNPNSVQYSANSLLAWQTGPSGQEWTPSFIIVKGAPNLGGDANVYDYTGQSNAKGLAANPAGPSTVTSDYWLYSPPAIGDQGPEAGRPRLSYQAISHVDLIYDPRQNGGDDDDDFTDDDDDFTDDDDDFADDDDDFTQVTKGADPPREGFRVRTNTDIECIGATEESESYTWQYGDGMIDLRVPYMLSGGAAEIRYEQRMKSVDGLTRFVKGFNADSHEQPNLTVSKSFGYVADPNSTAAIMEHEEKVGISNVNFGGILGESLSGFLTLCPWVTGQVLDAYNLGAAAGSKMKVTQVSASSESRANTLFLPGVSYGVSAEGVGEIEAGIVVDIFEGSSPFVPSLVAATVEIPSGTVVALQILAPDPPPIISRTTYEESARASGVWSFGKEMSFNSTLAIGGLPEPFQRVP